MRVKFIVIFILTLAASSLFYAQNNDKNRGKPFYTTEEVKQRCGVPVDTAIMRRVLAKQDSMYKDYLLKSKNFKANTRKIETIPDWQSVMSDVEDQGSCGDCWVHAATGITEGQLSILLSYRLNADLDELEISSACNSGFPSSAEAYIATYKMRSEVGSYPNLQGTRWGISGWDNSISGITSIKNALNSGPVAACFYVYADFSSFFASNPTGVYHHTSGDILGGHAVVIVSYNDSGQYWLCKNSWGSSWGDNGYFRIGYGECGIETYENSTVTVDQSCYAKIVPNLFSTINSAFNYPFVSNEGAIVIGNTSLTGNVSIPSGVTLTVASSASVNFGNYGILFNGGSVNVESGASFNYVNLKQGGTLEAYFGNPQAAINYASSGQSIELKSANYSGVSFSSKSNIELYGQGESNTSITSGISVTNSSNITLHDFSISGALNENNSSWTRYWNVTTTGSTIATDYTGTMNELGTISASNLGASFGITAYGGTGDIYSSNISNADCGVYLTNSASYNVGTGNTFCSNGVDIDAENGGYAYAISNDYSLALPSSIRGNVYITGINGVCSSPKALVVNNASSGLVEPPELKAIDDQYLALLRKVTNDRENNNLDIKNYGQDCQVLFNEYKNFINSSSDINSMGAALSKLSKLYKFTGNYGSFVSYINSSISNGTLKSAEPFLKRYLIWTYVDKNDYPKSIKTADEVIAAPNASSDLKAEMLYEKGLIYKYYLGDKSKANDMYASIISKYPTSPLTIFASNEMGIKPDYSFKKAASESNQNVKATSNELNNYPNPFNPATMITYSLKEKDHVTLVVFDILGKEVTRLVDGIQTEGEHSVNFDGSSLPSGMYIYQLQGTNFNISKKMLLLK